MPSHRVWIEALLREYYDPMYAFQREKKGSRMQPGIDYDPTLFALSLLIAVGASAAALSIAFRQIGRASCRERV